MIYPAENFPDILVGNAVISKLSISVFVQCRHQIPDKLDKIIRSTFYVSGRI